MRGPTVALVLLSLLGCKKPADAEAEHAEPKTVKCEPAEAGEVRDRVTLRGTISALPDRDAQVAPQVAGRILTMLAREGDAVVSGQVVARIDDGPLVDDSKAADAALLRVKAEHRNAETTKARVQRVFEHGIAARQELDDASAKAEAAAAAEAEADAAAARARRQVDRASVRSPLTGVVVKVMRHPGELVDGTPATPVLEVADPSKLELVSDAAAADLVKLRANQPASVTVNALGAVKWEAKVAVVSPAVDRTTGLGVARVSLELGAPDSGVLRPPIGTLGAAEIEIGDSRPAVLVPARALRAATGDSAEIVICGPKAHVRNVHRHAVEGDRVAVDGVDAGETVAVDPVLGINDGDPLEPAGAEEK